MYGAQSKNYLMTKLRIGISVINERENPLRHCKRLFVGIYGYFRFPARKLVKISTYSHMTTLVEIQRSVSNIRTVSKNYYLHKEHKSLFFFNALNFRGLHRSINHQPNCTGCLTTYLWYINWRSCKHSKMLIKNQEIRTVLHFDIIHLSCLSFKTTYLFQIIRSKQNFE